MSLQAQDPISVLSQSYLRTYCEVINMVMTFHTFSSIEENFAQIGNRVINYIKSNYVFTRGVGIYESYSLELSDLIL